MSETFIVENAPYVYHFGKPAGMYYAAIWEPEQELWLAAYSSDGKKWRSKGILHKDPEQALELAKKSLG